MKEYIRQLNLTPSDVRTVIELAGIEAAIDKAMTLQSLINNMPRHVAVAVQFRALNQPPSLGGAKVKHAGGLAGSSGPVRVSSGMRSDEVMTILQKGEMVLPKGAAAAPSTIIYNTIDARGAQRGVGEEIAAAIDARMDEHAVKEARHYRSRR